MSCNGKVTLTYKNIVQQTIIQRDGWTPAFANVLYDTAMSKATLADLDRTIFLKAARWAFWSIRENWATARCYYGNPLQRVNTPNSTEADDWGNWLRDLIERMARRYGFVVIDAFGESGIVREFEVNGGVGRYLNDGLHPTTVGKQLQGRFYANEILNEYVKQL